VQWDGVNFYTQTTFWQDTAAGESTKQTSTPKLVKGKNIGRANETSDLKQAQSELNAMVAKQLDKGYSSDNSSKVISPPILPMLAHKFADRGSKMVFPAFVQLKENGFRCLFDGTNFWSRQGKIVNAQATNHLRFETDGRVYDGELVLPAPFTFQQTCSAIKKFDPVISPQLEYRVYDLYDPLEPDMPYFSRHDKIWCRCFSLPKQVRLVSTETALTVEDMYEIHKEFVARGAEGSIVRAIYGVYKPGHRSADLLKVKDMQDDEFTIIGFTDGQGKDAGAVIFKCIADGGAFDVRPEGSTEARREMFLNGVDYIGKKLTVRFQTLTDKGIPLFPVGVIVRDYGE